MSPAGGERRAALRALAKINLHLEVLSRRPDGYHELRTIFQTISLADELTLAWRPARRTRILLHDEPPIPDNLVTRAAELVLAQGARPCRLTISLRKRIPMGAGLGGGSSNAAAILLALPVLAGLSIPPERLLELAAQLGSDVPFFLLGGAALGLSRGELLFPLAESRPRWGVLIAPAIHVSTAQAYRALHRGLTIPLHTPTMERLRALALAGGFPAGACSLRASLVNDFEEVVFPSYPRIEQIRQFLASRHARLARLSGSGSAVFGLFDHAAEARAAARAFSPLAGERAFVFQTVSRQRYWKMWWQSLAEHGAPRSWPPLSRYSS